jgi:hypothetical protein
MLKTEIVAPNAGRAVATVWTHEQPTIREPRETKPSEAGQANARLIAAAPELYDGCNAMLGLVQLLLGRDDLSDDLRLALTTNHRIAEAEAAVAKAGGER